MFSTDFAVRFSETDGAGHVGNTVMVVWFEEARTPVFELFSPTLNMQEWPLILASYQVDFHAQLYYGKPVSVKTWVKKIGNSSFQTYQEAWQDGKLCNSGTTTMVHYDYIDQKTVAIPESIKQLLSEHLLPPESD